VEVDGTPICSTLDVKLSDNAPAWGVVFLITAPGNNSMKHIFFLLAGILVFSGLVAGEPGGEILAKRGEGEVTQLEFDARMARIPESDRATFLRDGERLETMLGMLLTGEQLAAEARAAGFDQDELIQAHMKLAAEKALAEAWTDHYVASQGVPDLEALAREAYDLNPQEFSTVLALDVSHILISTKERTEEDALDNAMEVLEVARNEPSSFDALILEHSEDPSIASNKGHYSPVRKGDMARSFEEAAFALEPGQISEPVLTRFGYHIIRVNEVFEPELMEFEKVRSGLMDRELKRHEQRVRNNYLNQLSSLDVEMTEEALKKMLSRYFESEVLSGSTPPDSE